ncbi:MAG TPA: sigma-70 family RNA polymerase sigma factor [Ilumatobacteraceae bacterium]
MTVAQDQASNARRVSDEALVERVREGDNDAFAELYRRHAPTAKAFARRILHSEQDSEDATSDAFANVLSALRHQVGPRELFRPYLLACVRNSCTQRIRQRSRQSEAHDKSMTTTSEQEADDRIVEGSVAATAFRSLPVRWQAALWMSEVEHLDAATLTERLGVRGPAAAALVHRARQGFSEAYLTQHLRTVTEPTCAALSPKLAQYVRGSAGSMVSRQVDAHVETCAACATAVKDLRDVNASLRSVGPPVVALAAVGASAAVGGATSLTAATLGASWFIKAAAVVALAAASVAIGHEPSRTTVAAASHASAASTVDAEVSVSAQTGQTAQSTTGTGPAAIAPLDATHLDAPGSATDGSPLTLPPGVTAPLDDVIANAEPTTPNTTPGAADTPPVSADLAVLTSPLAPQGSVPTTTSLPNLPAITLPTTPTLPGGITLPTLPDLGSTLATVPAVLSSVLTVPPAIAPVVSSVATLPSVVVSVVSGVVSDIVTVPSVAPTLPTLPVIPLLPGLGLALPIPH